MSILRKSFSLLSLTVALAIPAAAHADTTFTYTPSGGSAYSFTLAGLTADPVVGQYADYYSNTFDVTFYNSVYAANYTYPGLTYGQFDFYLNSPSAGINDFNDGVQLYTGSETNPQFIDGKYVMAADPLGGYGNGGTLVISGGATPEPSSFVLLGTGALSLAAAARRRFRKA